MGYCVEHGVTMALVGLRSQRNNANFSLPPAGCGGSAAPTLPGCRSFASVFHCDSFVRRSQRLAALLSVATLRLFTLPVCLAYSSCAFTSSGQVWYLAAPQTQPTAPNFTPTTLSSVPLRDVVVFYCVYETAPVNGSSWLRCCQ